MNNIIYSQAGNRVFHLKSLIFYPLFKSIVWKHHRNFPKELQSLRPHPFQTERVISKHSPVILQYWIMSFLKAYKHCLWIVLCLLVMLIGYPIQTLKLLCLHPFLFEQIIFIHLFPLISPLAHLILRPDFSNRVLGF